MLVPTEEELKAIRKKIEAGEDLEGLVDLGLQGVHVRWWI
jgi:hypothetical protein